EPCSDLLVAQRMARRLLADDLLEPRPRRRRSDLRRFPQPAAKKGRERHDTPGGGGMLARDGPADGALMEIEGAGDLASGEGPEPPRPASKEAARARADGPRPRGRGGGPPVEGAEQPPRCAALGPQIGAGLDIVGIEIAFVEGEPRQAVAVEIHLPASRGIAL